MEEDYQGINEKDHSKKIQPPRIRKIPELMIAFPQRLTPQFRGLQSYIQQKNGAQDQSLELLCTESWRRITKPMKESPKHYCY